MSEFKVGDKVRATEEFAQETLDWAGGVAVGIDLPVTERRTLTVVNTGGTPWPVGAMLHPAEYDGDPLGPGMLLFNTDEIELVED